MSTEVEDEAPEEAEEEQIENETCGCGFEGPGAMSKDSDEDGHCCTCANSDDDCECIACGCGEKYSNDEYNMCDSCEDVINCCCNCWVCMHCSERYHEDSVCHDCEYCENCGCSCDEGEGSGDNDGKGFSHAAPWRERGIDLQWPKAKTYPERVVNICSEYEVARFMGLDSKTIDPTQAMAGYYLTEFVASAVMCSNGMQYEPDVESYVLEGQRLKDEIVTQLDKPFQLYVDMACGGELRHHNVFRGSPDLSNTRPYAWYDWMQIRRELGSQALLDMAKLFDEFNSKGGYGGKLWGDGARVLHLRETGAISPAIFIDRVFNLQHNGGCFLNKLPWDIQNEPKWGLDSMVQHIGPAHSANPPVWPVLMAASKMEIRKVFTAYWRAVNKAKAGWRLPREPVPGILDGSQRGYRNRSVYWELKFKQPKSEILHNTQATWEDCPLIPEPKPTLLPEVGKRAGWGKPENVIHRAAKAWNEGNARDAFEMLVWCAETSGRFKVELWGPIPKLTNLGEEVMDMGDETVLEFGREMYRMLIDAQHSIDGMSGQHDRYEYVLSGERVWDCQRQYERKLRREAKEKELEELRRAKLKASIYNGGNAPMVPPIEWTYDDEVKGVK